MKDKILHADAEYRYFLKQKKFDDYVLVPVGFVTVVLIAMYGLWLICQSHDLLCLVLAIVCSYFARPLFRPLFKRGAK